MGDNPTNEEVIDPELAKARKSMGSRIDPDPLTPKEPEEPKTPVEPPKEPVVEPKVPEEPKEPVTPPASDVEPPKAPNRPEAYIPMPKYLAEKKDWESTQTQLAEANKKIEELTKLAGQKDGTQKDEDIQEFMAKTGFDQETVEGFLALAEKRLAKGETMTQEERAAVTKATEIVKEAELETAFNEEFKSSGEPVILKSFPNATKEQLAMAKDLLDKMAHTKYNHDKPLDFLIFKAQDEFAKLFAEPEPETPPQTKKTIEPSKMGNGKQTSITAADFKDGGMDFGALTDLDQSVRSEIIKNFDPKTYSAFINYAKGQDGGTTVMRNGQRVVLK